MLAILTIFMWGVEGKCQAERLIEQIQEEYDEIRDSMDSEGECAKMNFQHHNLCSLLLAKTFTQR